MLIRIVSALVAIAIVVPVILLSPLLFFILLALAVGFCLHEFLKMALAESRTSIALLATGLGVIFFFNTLIAFPDNLVLFFASTFFLLFILSSLFLGFEKNLRQIPGQLGLCFFGFFYIVFSLSHLAFLRLQPEGGMIILWIMAGTFVGDSLAYFSGRLFGKHLFFPRISPKKTWEGFAGHIIGAFLGVFLFQALFGPQMVSLQDKLVVGGLCALFGTLGDLCESMLKRGFDVKDSGTFMPGHGGLLDRIDGLLFTAPAVYYYGAFFGPWAFG